MVGGLMCGYRIFWKGMLDEVVSIPRIINIYDVIL